MRIGAVAAFAVLAVVVASTQSAATASVPTMNECLEASDFVANAARARDNGVERDVFVARMQDDFVAIRAFPPALRWFVKDDDDERFLERAAEAVYDHPQAPERHRAAFLRTCLARLAGDGEAQPTSSVAPEAI